MYLFDANSIMNLVKKGVVKAFARGVALNLALYESLNAIWKEYALLKRIDEDTAKDFIGIVSDVFSVIEVMSVRGFEGEVFALASREGLTMYDASYLHIAAKNNLILVTDDRKLKGKASKYVKTASSSTLARR